MSKKRYGVRKSAFRKGQTAEPKAPDAEEGLASPLPLVMPLPDWDRILGRPEGYTAELDATLAEAYRPQGLWQSCSPPARAIAIILTITLAGATAGYVLEAIQTIINGSPDASDSASGDDDFSLNPSPYRRPGTSQPTGGSAPGS